MKARDNSLPRKPPRSFDLSGFFYGQQKTKKNLMGFAGASRVYEWKAENRKEAHHVDDIVLVASWFICGLARRLVKLKIDSRPGPHDLDGFLFVGEAKAEAQASRSPKRPIGRGSNSPGKVYAWSGREERSRSAFVGG